MATATAWFRATTGLSEMRIRSSYCATICGQSVAVGARLTSTVNDAVSDGKPATLLIQPHTR